MNRAAKLLLHRYLGKPGIFDTNLLLFYWCVKFDPAMVHTFKRLNSFCEDDIRLMLELVKLFPVVRTTSHVLTEVSNLANQLPQWRKLDWSKQFAGNVAVVSEEWEPAQAIVKDSAIALGLTDAYLCLLASTNVIFTMDFPLSNYLQSKKLNVVNFNHLREMQFND